jgi:hypothetical protein
MVAVKNLQFFNIKFQVAFKKFDKEMDEFLTNDKTVADLDKVLKDHAVKLAIIFHEMYQEVKDENDRAVLCSLCGKLYNDSFKKYLASFIELKKADLLKCMLNSSKFGSIDIISADDMLELINNMVNGQDQVTELCWNKMNEFLVCG